MGGKVRQLHSGSGWLTKDRGRPEAEVYADIVEYLKKEKCTSEEGLARISAVMPSLEGDFVAYGAMKDYVIDEYGDLQETNQDLELIELIGLQNWLVKKMAEASQD